MVLNTQEESSRATTLRYSCSQTELSLEITENSLETIHDAASFSKLFLVIDNLFEHLSNLQDDF